MGHAERRDRCHPDGDPAARDQADNYWQNTKLMALAAVRRDLDNLRAEVASEQETPA